MLKEYSENTLRKLIRHGINVSALEDSKLRFTLHLTQDNKISSDKIEEVGKMCCSLTVKTAISKEDWQEYFAGKANCKPLAQIKQIGISMKNAFNMLNKIGHTKGFVEYGKEYISIIDKDLSVCKKFYKA